MFAVNDLVSWTRYKPNLEPYTAIGEVAQTNGHWYKVRENDTGYVDEIIGERLTPIDTTSAQLLTAINQIKALLPHVPAGPWYAGEESENDFGSMSVTVGPHPAPHYEDMIAEFFLGNHSPAVYEVVILMMNNLELLIKAAERSVAK
jgi:hypothetical protein